MLDVRDLTVTYGSSARATHAVRGVSFTVRPGETLAIVGESGCGKSTTARVVAGLERATTGEVRVEDHDIRDVARSRSLRHLVQMVFQHSDQALNRSWTVEQAVAEPLGGSGRTLREVRAAVLASLVEVGLDSGYLHRSTRDLSGGQAQRVAIARALVGDPSYVVLDEPTASLDQSVRSRVLALLQRLQAERKMGYVFISHDLRSVRRIAHRVAVMYLGRIVEEAPVEQIFARPRHPYTRALLAAEPPIAPGTTWSVVPLPGETPSASRIPAGCAFRSRCAFAIEACAHTDPVPVALGTGRTAACIRIEELP